MDIRQLRYFLEVVHAGSFTKAADRVRVAQPALGIQIRKLEEELGVSLLVRHSRGVEPTEAGRLLLDHANAILRRIELARQEIIDLSGPPRGSIALGITPTASALLATPLISACRETYPRISLTIVEGLSEEVMRQLGENAIDIGFTYNPTAVHGISAEPLLIEDLYYVSAADGGGRDAIPFREACGASLILPGRGFGLRERIEAAAGKRELSVDVAFEINSVSTIRELVESGIGSTILPYAAVARAVASGRLAAARITRPRISRTLSLAYASGHVETNVSRAVRQIVDRVIGEIAAAGGSRWRRP